MSLLGWLSTPPILALLERYVLATEQQAAATQRLAELKAIELGVDPASLEAAAAAAGPHPAGTVVVGPNEDDLQAVMTDIADALAKLQGRTPSPEAVIAEYERQYGRPTEEPEPQYLAGDLEPSRG